MLTYVEGLQKTTRDAYQENRPIASASHCDALCLCRGQRDTLFCSASQRQTMHQPQHTQRKPNHNVSVAERKSPLREGVTSPCQPISSCRPYMAAGPRSYLLVLLLVGRSLAKSFCKNGSLAHSLNMFQHHGTRHIRLECFFTTDRSLSRISVRHPRTWVDVGGLFVC